MGPESAWALGCWDQTFARIFVKNRLADNLLHNLRFGSIATTDFSGFDSPENRGVFSCRQLQSWLALRVLQCTLCAHQIGARHRHGHYAN
jgi:hypothetical protein